MRPDRFSLAKAWINDERSTPEEAKATWEAMGKEFDENRKTMLMASAESDKIKNMMNKKYGPGTMKYGSEISQPPQRPDVIEIDAINAFMRRNPAAEGGRMRFDNGLSAKQKKALTITYPKDATKDLEIKKTKGGDRKLLKELVEEANKGFKFVKRKDLQVQAGYNKSTNITAKEIGLDTLETKLRKAFDYVMGDPNKLVVDMFDPMSQVKKLVGTNDAPGRYLKGYEPYESNKKIIKVLAIPKSKTKLRKAEGLTLGNLEFRIDNNIKGDVLFAPPKQVSAETKIFDIADRHIKQGGTKIEWTVKPEITSGGSTSYGEARFKYNGKEYGMGELINNAKDDPNFKEFFKAQREYKTINDKIVEHPKTGEKIRFGNLMKEVYGDSVVPYNVDHYKSILDEPFTSLRVLPRRINTAAGNIKSFNEMDITNPALSKKYSDAGKEMQLKKIGYNYNQSIDDLIEAELKLAKDVLVDGRVLRKPNKIIESIRKGENYKPDFYSKDAKPGKGFAKVVPDKEIKDLIKSVGCPNFKSGGGRIEFSEGADCFDKGQKLINNGMKDASPASKINAAKFLNSAYKTGRNVMKFGIIPEAIFVSGESLLRSLGDQTLDEGFKSAIGFYTDFTGLTDFKADARISQNLRNMGVDATMNIEKLVNFNNAKDDLNKLKENQKKVLSAYDENLMGGVSEQDYKKQSDANIVKAQEYLDKNFLKESEKLYYSQQQDTAADIAGTRSPFQKAYAAAKNKTENLRSDGSIIDLNDLSGMQSDMFMIDPMSAQAKKARVKNLPPQSPLTGSKGEQDFLNLSQLPMGPRMGSEIDVLAKAMNENFAAQGLDQRTDAAYLKAMQDYKQNYKDMTMEEMLAIGIPREAIYGFNQPEVIKEKPVYDFSEGGITGLRSKYDYKK